MTRPVDLEGLRALVLDELDNVTSALAQLSHQALNTSDPVEDDLQHWTERLARVNRALHDLDRLAQR